MRTTGALIPLAIIGLVAGCAVDTDVPGDEELGEVSQELRNGSLMSFNNDQWGTPSVPGCSSTLLRNQWVLTAKHCPLWEGMSVTMNGATRTVTKVILHPDWLMDVALLRLNAPFTPAGSATTRGPFPLFRGPISRLQGQVLRCQGWGATNADCHWNTAVPGWENCSGFELRTANIQVDQTISVKPNGHVFHPGAFTNTFRMVRNGQGQIHLGGDSGSSCLTSHANVQKQKVTGTYWFHEGLLGDPMGLDGIWYSHLMRPDLFRDWANGIIGTAPTQGFYTGYERNDTTSAVVFRTGSVIRELNKAEGNWTVNTLPLVGGAASNLAATVRQDGYNEVVVRNASNQIFALTRFPGGVWQPWDLSTGTGALPAAGNPGSFVRADGVSTIVFRNAAGNGPSSLSLENGSWVARVLPTHVAPSSDLIGHVRADGVSAIVYRGSDNKVHQLTRAITDTDWTPWNLHNYATGSPALATGTPHPYTRSDGVSAVVYRDSSNNIWDISFNHLTNSGWVGINMTAFVGGPTATTDPMPYVRGDGVTAIVYRGSDGHVRELALTPSGWVNSDLNTVCNLNAPAPRSGATNAPTPYVRSDRTSAVVYVQADGMHLWELSLPFGGGCWSKKNLTQEAGTTLL